MAVPTLARVAALVAIAVIATAGLCLFDVDHAGVGQCPASLAIAAGLLVSFALMAAGAPIPALAPAHALFSGDPTTPPPK